MQPPKTSFSAKSTPRNLLGIALSGLILLAPHCVAQQNSGASAITLTAVLSQSLTISVGLDAASADKFGAASFTQSPALEIPLEVQAMWVRGKANPGVDVFASGNRLLGAAGRYAIPVEIPAPDKEKPAPTASGFLTSSNSLEKTSRPGVSFTTKELQIPSGSDAGTLTIRAQAL